MKATTIVDKDVENCNIAMIETIKQLEKEGFITKEMGDKFLKKYIWLPVNYAWIPEKLRRIFGEGKFTNVKLIVILIIYHR